jgi:Domain of unknown function (DUF4845)
MVATLRHLGTRMMKKSQQGLSLIGLILVLALGACGGLVAFKAFPAYMEYLSIRKALTTMATAGEMRSGPPENIRRAFDKRAQVDDISSITGKDLEIQRAGNGYAVSYQYERRIPLIANISLVFGFQGASQDRAPLGG